MIICRVAVPAPHIPSVSSPVFSFLLYQPPDGWFTLSKPESGFCVCSGWVHLETAVTMTMTTATTTTATVRAGCGRGKGWAPALSPFSVSWPALFVLLGFCSAGCARAGPGLAGLGWAFRRGLGWAEAEDEAEELDDIQQQQHEQQQQRSNSSSRTSSSRTSSSSQPEAGAGAAAVAVAAAARFRAVWFCSLNIHESK